jgi:uncharacterized protein (TIGR02145 family)
MSQLFAQAQAPQKIAYQAVARNAAGTVLPNQTVTLRFSLRNASSNGTIVYQETQTATTSNIGLFNVNIGEGTVSAGTFAGIDWSNGAKFMQVELDPQGGNAFIDMGTQQMLSVPYALYANAAGNGIPSGSAVNQMLYWNGTAWVNLVPPAINGQVLTHCDGTLTWTIGGVCPGSITALSCSTATNSGTLTQGTAASGVSSSVPYTGGNGGTHGGQTVNSTGVTGLTATLSAGTFASGAGSLTYTIIGTPANSGTASFALSIGGQTCTLSRTVNAPVGSITALTCASATNSGTLTQGVAASGVSSSVPYTGGNGGTHGGQTVNSTGVTGLTATLTAGTFANGSGSLTYTITGTPVSSGTASFALSIGGQTCTLTRTVNANGQTGITAHTCGATNVHNPAKTYGTMTDQQGNVYKTIVIGTQMWMAENLKTTIYRNGDAIANADTIDDAQFANLTTGAWCFYNYSQYDCPYGKLYNWYAVADPRNVCPTGWHVPTHAEWTTLTSFLGGEEVAGDKLKSTGTQYWYLPNTDANNESGFSGLPGGNRPDVDLAGSPGADGRWWSSTESSATSAWHLYLLVNDAEFMMFPVDKHYGLSVRCIKD